MNGKTIFILYLLENFSFSDVRLVHKTQWWVLKVFDSLSCVLFDAVKTFIIFFQKNFFPLFSFLFYIFVYLYWLHIDITIYLCNIILYTGILVLFSLNFKNIKLSAFRKVHLLVVGTLGHMGATNNLWTQYKKLTLFLLYFLEYDFIYTWQ